MKSVDDSEDSRRVHVCSVRASPRTSLYACSTHIAWPSGVDWSIHRARQHDAQQKWPKPHYYQQYAHTILPSKYACTKYVFGYTRIFKHWRHPTGLTPPPPCLASLLAQ
jgi:hypothetical protein